MMQQPQVVMVVEISSITSPVDAEDFTNDLLQLRHRRLKMTSIDVWLLLLLAALLCNVVAKSRHDSPCQCAERAQLTHNA